MPFELRSKNKIHFKMCSYTLLSLCEFLKSYHELILVSSLSRLSNFPQLQVDFSKRKESSRKEVLKIVFLLNSQISQENISAGVSFL